LQWSPIEVKSVLEFQMTVDAHPAAVMEVRRILQEHLDELPGHPVVGLRLSPPVR
jgi:hypothetical protein